MTTPSLLRPVLLVEADPMVARLVEEVLQDEGYALAWRRPRPPAQLLSEVAALDPACVLLAEAGRGEYGAAWRVAAELAARMPPVPVVMFTTQQRAIEEAEAQQSARSQAAAFAALLPKPFDCDALLAVVTYATERTDRAPRHIATGWQALAQVVLGRPCTGTRPRAAAAACCTLPSPRAQADAGDHRLRPLVPDRSP